MAGYWPICLFVFGVFMDREELQVEVHKKRNEGQYISSHLDRRNYQLYGQILHERISPLWEQSGQSRAGNLARSGSQSDHRIRVIFPAFGNGHIIRVMSKQAYNKK